MTTYKSDDDFNALLNSIEIPQSAPAEQNKATETSGSTSADAEFSSLLNEVENPSTYMGNSSQSKDRGFWESAKREFINTGLAGRYTIPAAMSALNKDISYSDAQKAYDEEMLTNLSIGGSIAGSTAGLGSLLALTKNPAAAGVGKISKIPAVSRVSIPLASRLGAVKNAAGIMGKGTERVLGARLGGFANEVASRAASTGIGMAALSPYFSLTHGEDPSLKQVGLDALTGAAVGTALTPAIAGIRGIRNIARRGSPEKYRTPTRPEGSDVGLESTILTAEKNRQYPSNPKQTPKDALKENVINRIDENGNILTGGESDPMLRETSERFANTLSTNSPAQADMFNRTKVQPKINEIEKDVGRRLENIEGERKGSPDWLLREGEVRNKNFQEGLAGVEEAGEVTEKELTSLLSSAKFGKDGPPILDEQQAKTLVSELLRFGKAGSNVKAKTGANVKAKTGANVKAKTGANVKAKTGADVSPDVETEGTDLSIPLKKVSEYISKLSRGKNAYTFQEVENTIEALAQVLKAKAGKAGEKAYKGFRDWQNYFAIKREYDIGQRAAGLNTAADIKADVNPYGVLPESEPARFTVLSKPELTEARRAGYTDALRGNLNLNKANREAVSTMDPELVKQLDALDYYKTLQKLLTNKTPLTSSGLSWVGKVISKLPWGTKAASAKGIEEAFKLTSKKEAAKMAEALRRVWESTPASLNDLLEATYKLPRTASPLFKSSTVVRTMRKSKEDKDK